MPEKKKEEEPMRERSWLRRSWQEGAWVGRGGAGGDELSDLRRSNS